MRKNYTPQQLCDEIYKAVKISPEPMTRLDISTAIGRKKSPHIWNMIEHLVKTEYLKREVWHVPGGMVVYLYTASENNPDCMNVD